jgi:hypothetical protein
MTIHTAKTTTLFIRAAVSPPSAVFLVASLDIWPICKDGHACKSPKGRLHLLATTQWGIPRALWGTGGISFWLRSEGAVLYQFLAFAVGFPLGFAPLRCGFLAFGVAFWGFLGAWLFVFLFRS